MNFTYNSFRGICLKSVTIIKLGVILITLLLLIMTMPTNSNAWSNGGYSDDPNNPDYGTHDWIAQHALDFLPAGEKQYILDNINTYLYATELPDNPSGYGDNTKHHVYYYSDGSLQDNVSGVRAEEEYQKAFGHIQDEDYENAAKFSGTMTHYISDLAVFGHVMGANTDWGSETHHSDYENYVRDRTTSYTSTEFDKYLSFDGELANISAYQATLDLAYDTTFDVDGDYDCVWMDSDDTVPPPPSDDLIINEFELNPAGSDSGNEWVELYNPTDNPVDLSSWKLKNNDGDIESLSGTISSHGYKVNTFSSQWLDNTDEKVILLNSSSVIKDVTPIKADSDNDNRVWARVPNGVDTNSDNDWTFKTNTKGSSNGNRGSRAYDWSDNAFIDRCGESLNMAVNLVTDVLHTLAWGSGYVGKEVPNIPPNATASANVTKGYAPLSVKFTGLGTDLDGSIGSYYWDFDDGNTSVDQNPLHTFQSPGTYKVELKVTDNIGDTGLDNILIEAFPEDVNIPPTAIAEANITKGYVPLVVMFTGNGTDLDGYIDTYYWNFNDNTGSTSTNQIVEHTFQNPGIYNVTLTVIDDQRVTDIDNITIIVIQKKANIPPNSTIQANIPPSATIYADITTGEAPLFVSFNGSGTDADGFIILYYWDFDKSLDNNNDGNFTNDRDGEGKKVKWTFTDYRDYTVTLTVIDNNGSSINTNIEIDIKPAYSPYNTSIIADKTEGFTPLIVNFSGFGSGKYDSKIIAYYWSFDHDGEYSRVQNPTQIFNESGTYDVSFLVTYSDGAVEISSIKIIVKEKPAPDEENDDYEYIMVLTGCLTLIFIFAIIVISLYMILKKKKKL